MSDQTTDVPDVERLIEEIDRLRGQVTELQQRVEQLNLLAHEDTLTKLPNRRGFMGELEALIERIGRQDTSAAMLFVDLDDLKMINDSFGHRAGDEALIHVANLLTSGIRRGDIVARIGGDEFGILLENASEDSAHETASRLVELICGSEFAHDGDELPLSVAIGVAMIDGSDSPSEAVARADEEMYRRKAAAAA